MVQLQQPPQPGDPPTATPSRRRASNASYGSSGSQCMPWMVGVTLLQVRCRGSCVVGSSERAGAVQGAEVSGYRMPWMVGVTLLQVRCRKRCVGV